jgi:hypothetical protein
MYAITIENKVRRYLAISIDLVRYTEVYQCLCKKMRLTIFEINQEFNIKLDNKKSYKRQYQKQEKQKVDA